MGVGDPLPEVEKRLRRITPRRRVVGDRLASFAVDTEDFVNGVGQEIRFSSIINAWEFGHLDRTPKLGLDGLGLRVFDIPGQDLPGGRVGDGAVFPKRENEVDESLLDLHAINELFLFGVLEERLKNHDITSRSGTVRRTSRTRSGWQSSLASRILAWKKTEVGLADCPESRSRGSNTS